MSSPTQASQYQIKNVASLEEFSASQVEANQPGKLAAYSHEGRESIHSRLLLEKVEHENLPSLSIFWICRLQPFKLFWSASISTKYASSNRNLFLCRKLSLLFLGRFAIIVLVVDPIFNSTVQFRHGLPFHIDGRLHGRFIPLTATTRRYRRELRIRLDFYSSCQWRKARYYITRNKRGVDSKAEVSMHGLFVGYQSRSSVESRESKEKVNDVNGWRK
jgi:hypothetical protein